VSIVFWPDVDGIAFFRHVSTNLSDTTSHRQAIMPRIAVCLEDDWYYTRLATYVQPNIVARSRNHCRGKAPVALVIQHAKRIISAPYYIVCALHMIKPSWCTILLCNFISILYMFRATMCPSSGEKTIIATPGICRSCAS